MSPRPAGREYDIVLFGATGFTGGLTAEYLAGQAPPGTRWAIAGRDLDKVHAVADRLAESAQQETPVGVVHADRSDPASMRALAESCRVVASTVGPFVEHGEPLVAGVAKAGTDYLDITGEPEFVDRMWLAHQDTAQENGARLVHACGFESVPPDLGVWFTLGHLPIDEPLSITGFVRANARFSAGTYHSAVRAFSRARHSADASRQRRAREESAGGSTSGRRVGSLSMTPRRVPGSSRWAMPLPTIDPIVVKRSARALERYGPDFRYGHYADVGALPMLAVSMGGAGSLMAAAQVPFLRDGLLRLQRSGDGPDEQRRSASWFRLRFVSIVAGDEANPILTEVSGGDPGYDETGKMLAESALCLAFDDLPERAGQLTPVQAMGDALLARLQNAGLSFRAITEP